MNYNVFKKMPFYLLLGFLCLSLSVSATMAAAVTISGTIMTVDHETDQDMPVPSAWVSMLDFDENLVAEAVCDENAFFELNVPDDSYVEPRLQGSENYVDTYYPYIAVDYYDAEDLADLNLEIIQKATAQAVIDELNAIESLDEVNTFLGVVAGAVEARHGGVDSEEDYTEEPGVKITFQAFPSGASVEGVLVYMNEDGNFDPSLESTSSEGTYIIYNIQIGQDGHTNLKMDAVKEGYTFAHIVSARVYPYQDEASPEKLTIVPFEGWEITQEGDTSTDDDGGGGGGGGS